MVAAFNNNCYRAIFLEKEALQQEPNNGNEQGGKKVERLAIFQIEQSKTAARDEQSAHNEQLCHERIRLRRLPYKHIHSSIHRLRLILLYLKLELHASASFGLMITIHFPPWSSPSLSIRPSFLILAISRCIVRLVIENLCDNSVAEMVGFNIINSSIDTCLSEICVLFAFTTFLATSTTLSATLSTTLSTTFVVVVWNDDF